VRTVTPGLDVGSSTTGCSSTSRTRSPSTEATRAAARPGAPPPITRTSTCTNRCPTRGVVTEPGSDGRRPTPARLRATSPSIRGTVVAATIGSNHGRVISTYAFGSSTPEE
jgi:hypothetical protein